MDKPEPLSDDEILDLLEDADLLTTAKFRIIDGPLRSKPTGVIRKVVDGTQRIIAARYEARIAELERERDALRADAERYQWLRGRDLNTIAAGGVFAGMTPQNIVINGADLDSRIDAERAAEGNPNA